ncbi:MAG: mechanosensitive ion channel [Phycisphaerales bacterium]|nr:mechanosensitive ion channel [Phycisphaerales bacterium]
MSAIHLWTMLAQTEAAGAPAAEPPGGLWGWLHELVPFGATTVLVLAVLAGVHWLLITRRPGLTTSERLPRQLTMLGLSVVGLAAIALSLPIKESTQAQIMAFLGVVVTGVIGLSSTTLVANAMAGLMLRSVRSFRPGDFVKVGEHLGRVTERGLFHTEIQTEDRDLTTLPNLYLIQNPLKVVRSSGTIVSATISLGYDLDHERIEKLLVKAAESAGLEEPFAQVLELGDFSVTYRIAGFLGEVKQILSARSRLRRSMLDTLHGDGVEIVSPNFMNQRQLDPSKKVIPSASAGRQRRPAALEEELVPEEIIFDKADVAERQSALEHERGKIKERIAELKKSIAAAKEDDLERPKLEAELTEAEQRLEAIAAEVEELAPEVEATEKEKEPGASPVESKAAGSRTPSGATGNGR